MGAGEELLDKMITLIIDPALRVVFTLGLFLFLWGVVEFLYKLSKGEVSPEGKNHMVWGLVGMLIMVSVYGIIALIVNTFELRGASTDVGRMNSIQTGNPFSDTLGR